MSDANAAKEDRLSTLVDLLEWRALTQPDDPAYIFLEEGEEETSRLTFSQLANEARSLARELRREHAVGTRALLLYPPGLSFLVGFFGCLHAGLIPVPAYPPRPNRHYSRLAALIADCGASLALTTPNVHTSLKNWNLLDEHLGALRWVIRDHGAVTAPEAFVRPEIDGTTVAFLQYTSGSTGKPKGVVVTHDNLLHNEACVKRAFSHSEKTVFVGWLPLFHDMGLIGNVLQPLYLGVVSVLMPPMAFLQTPVRWLRAISRYRATTSGAPNFAYALCTEKVLEEDCGGLDLSSWDVAYNGSEPVRAETIERFSARFAAYGFRREACYPCYGMAETTLFATGGDALAAPALLDVDASELKLDRVRPPKEGAGTSRLVGCGRPWVGMDVRIVDPVRCTETEAGAIGEIWVSGGSVAAGYWNRPEETRATFHNELPGRSAKYLRTGDLGFMDDGHLYVTGRLKDVVIIRGKNHYPHDIERTAESAHPALASGGGAAFSVDEEGEERLVLVHEIELAHRRNVDETEIVAAIRNAVITNHDIRVHRVVLLKPRTLPKTSSGKVQRAECRRLFLKRELPEYVGKPRHAEEVSA